MTPSLSIKIKKKCFCPTHDDVEGRFMTKKAINSPINAAFDQLGTELTIPTSPPYPHGPRVMKMITLK
jgi:hypothetical protein